MATNRIHRLLHDEAAPGIVLIAVAALAIALANSPLHPHVYRLFSTNFTISYGTLGLSKPLLLWINDGLMAIFFLLVGLEIKREAVEGALSKPAQIAMPAVAALGGMLVPAAIFVSLNTGDTVALRGWAVPAATDIAFSIGVLAVLGSRVPLSLKLFLTTLAIIDDLGAIVIIAIFYTDELSTRALVFSGACIGAMLVMSLLNVRRVAPYLLLGIVLWICVLKSGVHATLAGVIIAIFLPLKDETVAPDQRPFIRLEHALKPWVSFLVMPIFALANAGLPLSGLSLSALTAPIPLGIALGLFFGKQIGVFLPAAAFILLRLAPMPAGGTWLKLYGVSACAGIGFTMSLFIGMLAWPDAAYAGPLRLGVIVGSVASAIVAFLIMWLAPRPSSSS